MLHRPRHRPAHAARRRTCACAATGGASFLLESVEQGRLGRYSLVGCGSRLLTYEEAEAAGEAVVGYLAYDFVAKLEPTVPLPDAGRGLPESRFVVADVLVRFDHARGVAEVLARRPGGDDARCSRATSRGRRASRAARGETLAPADAGRLRARRRGVQGAHPHRRRVPDRALAARRAPHRRLGARALPLAAARQPVAVPLPARARRPRARRLLARDARQVRGAARLASTRSPGSTQPGEGDAERLLSSEKDRAEHVMLVDLGRNDLSRVCRPGTVKVERFLEAGALLAHHAPRLRGRGRAARRRDAVRPAARDASRPAPSRARRRCARCRSSPSSRATAAGRTRAPCSTRCRAGRSTRASRSARSSCTTASRCCRRAPASSPTATRAPSTRSACASSPRSRPRSTWRRRR